MDDIDLKSFKIIQDNSNIFIREHSDVMLIAGISLRNESYSGHPAMGFITIRIIKTCQKSTIVHVHWMNYAV